MGIITAIVHRITHEFDESGTHLGDPAYLRIGPLDHNPDPAREKWNGDEKTPGFVTKSSKEQTDAKTAADTAAANADVDRALSGGLSDVLAVFGSLLEAVVPEIVDGKFTADTFATRVTAAVKASKQPQKK